MGGMIGIFNKLPGSNAVKIGVAAAVSILLVTAALSIWRGYSAWKEWEKKAAEIEEEYKETLEEFAARERQLEVKEAELDRLRGQLGEREEQLVQLQRSLSRTAAGIERRDRAFQDRLDRIGADVAGIADADLASAFREQLRRLDHPAGTP